MLPGIGFSEIIVLAILALVVVGPKDLPLMLRKMGRFMARMRAMAAEFRAGFDELARQAELDELKREVDALRRASQRGVAGFADEITRPVDLTPIPPPTPPTAIEAPSATAPSPPLPPEPVEAPAFSEAPPAKISSGSAP
jgi:sec-independent protein translocase protein TatB